MRRPLLSSDAIFAALLAAGVAGSVSCGRSEKPAAESFPAPAPPPPSEPGPSPEPAAVAPTPAATTTAVGGNEISDGGVERPKKGGVQHACGAGACSADLKKGNK